MILKKILLLFVVTFMFVSCNEYEEGYLDGSEDGYKKGKNDGYEEGYDEGRSEGYNNGYDEGQQESRYCYTCGEYIYY